MVGGNYLVSQGIGSLLKSRGIVATVEARDAEEYLRLLERDETSAAADVALIDARGNFDMVLSEAKRLREARPKLAVIILMDSFDPKELVTSVQAGVNGYLLKSITVDALVYFINLVMIGETVFPSNLAAFLTRERAMPMNSGMNGDAGINLSNRERQILDQLVSGNSNKIIANHLSITEATVKVHIKNLLKKIKVKNRTQAAMWAVSHGVTIPENRALSQV
ncbi:MAG: LuxR C-terminal-related transcriptional regulator [Alphaproteobacteria bacterium]